MKRILILAGAAALSACGGETGGARPQPAGYVPIPSGTPAAPLPANTASVKGQTAKALIAQFGRPALDLSEGPARKLQFAGPICVLDAYLYPQGRGEPVVTWLDTRMRDGGPIDQASCVAALTKRAGR